MYMYTDTDIGKHFSDQLKVGRVKHKEIVWRTDEFI